MTQRKVVWRTNLVWIAVAALLLSPACTRAARIAAIRPAAGNILQDSQRAQENEQERREREQEAREREQERREREQEARDREQEKADRLQELYDDGREALDEDRYDKAEAKFDQLAQLKGPQTDAALYWKAYAANKLGQRDLALATLADMKKRFSQSRWLKDASVLELEVKQSSGQQVKPGDQSDEDLKMLAIQGLMNSDAERAMPLLEKVINGSGSPREKSRALFVLAQSGSREGREIIGRIAKGQSNPELQREAIKYLGLFGGAQSHQIMAEVYATNPDVSVRRAILRAYMLGGDRERLFAAAKPFASLAWSMELASSSSCIRQKHRPIFGGKSCRRFFSLANRENLCKRRRVKKIPSCGELPFGTLGLSILMNQLRPFRPFTAGRRTAV